MTYNKLQILSKIKEIVNKSDYLPDWIIDQAEKYEDIAKLEKLLVFLWDINQKEQQLSPPAKQQIDNLLTNFYQEKTKIYQETFKTVLYNAQQEQNIKDENQAEQLLNNL